MSARRPYDGAWKRVRLRVLERDGRVCQIRGRGCSTIATEVDHIIPVSVGGAWWDLSNLRAACRRCNLRRIAEHGAQQWQTAGTRITLVIGPPSVDLAAWVRGHARAGDLVIDQAALVRALGGESEAALSARNALVTRLRRGQVAAPRAWITSHQPLAPSLYPHHQLVELDAEPSADAGAGGAAGQSSSDRAWLDARAGRAEVSQPSRSW